MKSKDFASSIIPLLTHQFVINSIRWQSLKHIADDKKSALKLAHDVNTFHIEAAETMVC